MTDEPIAAANGADPIAEQPASRWEFALTPAGDKAKIAIPAAEGGHLVCDLSAVDFEIVWATMGQIVSHMRIKGALPKIGDAPRGVTSWLIGQSNDPQFAKLTMIQIDKGLDSGVFLMLSDIDALRMADAIEQKVFAGMSEADKLKMIETISKPGKAKIILPANMRRH